MKNIRLKTARVSQGMTQMQLAARVGLKEIEISRMETGRIQPEPKVKQLIAAALGKPSHELFNS